MEEENRFKVVEIEKYNSEIEKNEKKIRDYRILAGLYGLGFGVGMCGSIFDTTFLRSVHIVFTFANFGWLLSSLKELVIAILKKTVLEQKLMDIESHIDERIEEMLNNVQLEIDNRMQEAIDGGKQR